MIEQPKHIPFENYEDAIFHIELSKVLESKIGELLSLHQKVENSELKVELESQLDNSLNVLIEGYTNLLLSFQQGYIK